MFRHYKAGSSAEKNENTPQSSLAKKFFSWLGSRVFLLFCILLTAGLLYLSFPKPAQPGWAWVALFPFIWGLLKLRGFWSSFFYAWLSAFIFHAASLYWVYYTCLHGGNLSTGLSLAAWWGLCALLSLQMAIFGGCCFFLKKTGAFFPILAACGWVAFEWLHQTLAFYALGFPWFMLGATQWNFPQTLQLVCLTGVYGLSFVLAWTGIQLGWAVSNPSVKKIVGSILLVAALFFGVYGFGQYRLEQAEKWSKGHSLLSVQTALMQPNIDQYKKWDEAFEQEIIDTVRAQAAQLTSDHVRLTVWPESVSPGPLTEEKYASVFEEIASSTRSYQLVGSFVPGEKQYVGAYLLPPNSDEWQVYQKIQLVPFGEFVPLQGWLQTVFPDVEVLGELGSFTPGSAMQPLLNMEGVLLGSTICYEAIFPQIWLSQVRKGAKLFINITNDAWFFDTAAPYQHLAANVIRAVETGRPVLRAANTGFSAIISPIGKIERKSGLFTPAILEDSVPLAVKEYNTFYAQWGDWFAWLCTAVFFTLLISTIVFVYE